MNIIQPLLQIIENPEAKKGYLNLKKCLEEGGRLYEASAINHLIEKKFERKPNNIPPDQKQ